MGLSTSFGIIGCGNMGAAIAEAMIEQDIISPKELYLTDKDPTKAILLAEKTGGGATGIRQLADLVDMAMLSVKPQDFEAVSAEVRKSPLRRYVSIMAGKTIEEIRWSLSGDVEVARVMPNMAASVKKSVSAVSFSENFTGRELVLKIFSAIGEIITVDELSMDAVTAVSGSGPAYFFYFIECLFKAACKKGFSEEDAQKLVHGTFLGSAELLKQTDISVGDLIKNITSRGGTTEAALNVLSEAQLEEIIDEAVTAAHKRAGELSEKG